MESKNTEIEGAVTTYLKERGGQGTTNIIRSLPYKKNDVDRALRRLKEKNVVICERSGGGNKNSVTWSIKPDKNSMSYQLITKKWDKLKII